MKCTSTKFTVILIMVLSLLDVSAYADSGRSTNKPTIYYLPCLTEMKQIEPNTTDSVSVMDYWSFKTYVKNKFVLPKDFIVKKDVKVNIKISFEIDSKGKLNKFNILNSDCPQLNKEVTKVFEKAPQWNLAEMDEKPVARVFEASFRISIEVDSVSASKLGGDTEGKDKTIRKKVYDITDEVAEFEGGQSALFKYIGDNMMYDSVLAKSGVQGRILIRFVIDTDGSVRNSRIFKSDVPILEKRALKVIGSMPKWKPASVKGEPVALYYIIPISFK